MARETTKKKSAGKKLTAPKKMLMLFTIVNREKAEFYEDLLQNFEVNMALTMSAAGTASSSMRQILGLTDMEKAVIVGFIKKEREKEALDMLEEKFRTVKGGKGIAYTVPLTSTIGVAIYQFLSNTEG